MLRNSFYIGQVVFEGAVLKGPQPPIIDRMTFDAVQRQLDRQWSGYLSRLTSRRTFLSK